MKQNKYDNDAFFSEYKKMNRSMNGLEGAGEWPILKEMLPELEGKKVLDLGCGFGWHCRYVREQGADSVIGIDISEKMIQKAREMTDDSRVSYKKVPIEDIHFKEETFDFIFSSLAFHYVEPFELICEKVFRYLKSGGSFVFSVEHPIFTSRDEQDWYYDEKGSALHWPVDHYQTEGLRQTPFLTENVTKYHRTVSTYINELIIAGFTIKKVEESRVTTKTIEKDPLMKDENRRPMFLLISVYKPMV